MKSALQNKECALRFSFMRKQVLILPQFLSLFRQRTHYYALRISQNCNLQTIFAKNKKGVNLSVLRG